MDGPGADLLSQTAGSSPYLVGAYVDNAVALVTSAHRGRTNVMTATWFAESSHIPVLLRVSIATGTLTHEFISETGWFALSLLARGQEDWAWGCGTSSGAIGRSSRRFGSRRSRASAGCLCSRDV